MPRLNVSILTLTRTKRIRGRSQCVPGAPRHRRAKEEADLSLRVRPQPGEDPRASQVRHAGVELVSEDDGEGHALFCLIGGVAEHQTLERGRGRREQHPR